MATENRIPIRDINVFNRNRERLIRASIDDMLLEILKNAFEYSNGLKIIFDDENGIVSFTNRINYNVDDFNFKDLRDKLTSFNRVTDKNFNEGLTTLLQTKHRIRVKDLCIQSAYSDDNYFQLQEVDDSSHYINNGELIKVNSFPFKKVWKVEIFTNDTENILKTESSDFDYIKKFDGFHSTFKRLVYEVLGRFSIPREYKVTINNNVYESDKLKVNINKLDHKRYERMDLYMNIEIPVGGEEKFLMLWQLSKKNFFQIVNNQDFDNKGAKGIIVLTNNKQFAEQNRTNISYWTKNYIQREIKEYVESHEKDVDLNKLMGKYSRFKDSMQNYLKEVLNISYLISSKVFFNTDYKKTDRLINITNYIETLNSIFRGFPLFENIRQDVNAKLFNDPHNQSPEWLDEEDFTGFTEELKVDFSKIFPRYVIGTLIHMGSLATIRLSDKYYIENNNIKGADPEVYTLPSLVNSEIEDKILYPTKFTNYLMDLEFVNPEQIEKELTELVSLVDMENFNLNPSKEETVEKEIELNNEDDEFNTLQNRDLINRDAFYGNKQVESVLSTENYNSIENILINNSQVEIVQNTGKEYQEYETKDNQIENIDKEIYYTERNGGKVVYGSKLANSDGQEEFGFVKTIIDGITVYKNPLDSKYSSYPKPDGSIIQEQLTEFMESEPIKYEEIEDTKIIEVSKKDLEPIFITSPTGKTMILNIVNKDTFQIPFLFTEKQWKKYKTGKQVSLGVSVKRYKAFSEAIIYIKEFAKVNHDLFLVFYYDDIEKEEAGCYFTSYGYIGVNTYNLKKALKDMTQINKSMHIIDLMCHEIAHDLIPLHNNLFIKQKEHLMIKSRKNSVDREVRKKL